MSAEELLSIDPAILSNYLLDWTRIPYAVFRAALNRTTEKNSDPTSAKIDEWILDNEKWLRHTANASGLVTLNQADMVFPCSVLTQTARIITRPNPLPGFGVLCDARQKQVAIQPSPCAFREVFESMSDGLLQNLDWANIMVAGGIALGALVSVVGCDPTLVRGLWDSSDIDLYVYGLSADEATAKIHHVYQTLRNNLPNGTPTLAVRNSKTITFYAYYPLRRIQVVLKLAESPKDVLLNFDLDICAIGWDGSDVLMLPRAARALETGYNTFTMEIIHGHPLSERRASQPQRIFKYASKGYGMRFLPSYIWSLSRSAEEIESLVHGSILSNLDIHRLATDARAWVRDKFVELRGTHRIRYSDMDEGHPGRSCLVGFTLFMRNVGYWEMAHRQDGIIDGPASDTYDDNYVVGPPQYKWGRSFELDAFRQHIEQSKQREIKSWVRSDPERLLSHGIRHGDELEEAQRMTCASRMEALLSNTHDIKIPLLLPCDFAAYANALVNRINEPPILNPVIPYADTGHPSDQREGLYIWTIASKLMWQQQDRRIDELFEVLQAFFRANAVIDEDFQAQRLIQQLSKRENRDESEFDAFFRWIYQPV